MNRRRLPKLVLRRDETVFVTPGGDETAGPELNGSQNINDRWNAWFRQCVQEHRVRDVALDIAADRWYWMVLSGPGASSGAVPAGDEEETQPTGGVVVRHSGRLGSEADLFSLEAGLPLPIEEIEARFVKSKSGEVLAAAADREQLSDWISIIEAIGPRVRSVRPADIEPAVSESIGGDGRSLLAGLEFRSGSFEHPKDTRHRVGILCLVAAAWGIACCVIGWGWLRMASQYDELAADANAMSFKLARSVLPADQAGNPDPERLLSALVERRRQARDQGAEQYRPKSAAEPFVAILTAWPDLPDVQVDGWRIDRGRMLIKGTSADSATADAIAAALKSALPADEWSNPRGTWQERSGRNSFEVSVTRKSNVTTRRIRP
ncbi:MAG: hypothetical protein KAS72_11465 [Phycisphaerales bacterium]|nr:hypothetical protein [Phycisphaerales bacterium]